jgi:squalene synthase HpnC
MTDDTLDKAYQHCLQLARRHYENFPTAARLLAKRHRLATAAIYAFARSADDIADEGDLSASERHARLDDYEAKLSHIQAGASANEPIFLALADTMHRYELPITPFTKLLQAFRSDIDTRRYASFNELATYCDHSASPVGELILRLHGVWNETNNSYSNHICTALQLINFIQDLDSDYQQRQRLYIPLDELATFSVAETDLAQHRENDNLRRLIDFQIQRARELLFAGQPLLGACRGRLRFVLKLTLFSALCLTEKLQQRNNVFIRPTLHTGDIPRIALHSLLFRPAKAPC